MSGDKTSVLVADVGGTHTRIALAHKARDQPQLTQLMSYPTPRGRLSSTLKEYMQANGAAALSVCAVAAAGRVRRLPGRTFVTLTNAQLTIDREDLSETTAAPTTLLINDRAAVAAALPLLKQNDYQHLGPLREMAPGLRLVVGVGTGFGAAVLTADGTLLESEAGHADLAAVTAEEREWLNRLAPLGRLSIESLISGPGLAKLYEVVSGRPAIPPEALIARAQAGEPVAGKVLVAFSTWLGRVVGNLVLTYGAWGGVYLVGGVLEGIGSEFDVHAFRQAMEDKAPFGMDLAAVPVLWIRHPQAALLGLARLALS